MRAPPWSRVRSRGVSALVGLVLALAWTTGSSLGQSASEPVASPYSYPSCPPGQAPRFVFGFASLAERLGPAIIGEPLECEYVDPRTGDAWQQTSTGQAFYRRGSGLPTFFAGPRHWALLADETLLSWVGPSLDPPATLTVNPTPELAFADVDLPPIGEVADRPDPATPVPVPPPASRPPAGAGAPAAATSGSPRPMPLPLNGRFLLVNMHGALFHERPADFAENVGYARWLGAGVIRVFATDSNTGKDWDGRRVGQQIAGAAPALRGAGVKLIVALVNNHEPVPGEPAGSAGWMDGYFQLLLPFYTETWRGPYLSFARDLISTVRDSGALDVVQAWELGNELHTPQNPVSLVRFITAAVQEIRWLDPATPIYPGTMGANHVEPWNPRSPIARWLYCQAPVDAYTLHAYDWVNRDRQGDMPIAWDLDRIEAEPCPSGRRLPVIVEELGTSRALPGLYGPDDEQARLQQEIRQLRFVLGYTQVQGVGVWSGESPKTPRTYFDSRRGLTSYGNNALGGGSCYEPRPDPRPGARCQLEQILRALPAPP